MVTSYNKIKNFKNFSSSQLSVFSLKTQKVYKLENLLSRTIDSKDNGVEVGSINYIKKSDKIFMKAKAVQNYNFLPRFDVGIFSDKYKIIKNLIENYRFGNSSFEDLGYYITRGQNLQISNIGKSIYSDKAINDNFYGLVLSNSITNNMSFRTEMFLGSKKNLKKIRYGDIIFTCRGNLGRCFVNCSNNYNMITNIDNVHISNDSSTIDNKVMVGCFLHYLKEMEYLKNISIQGSGADSFTKYHFDMIKIPNFPKELEKQLVNLYCNTDIPELNMLNFENEIQKYGLFYLERIKEIIREEIKQCFKYIINDKEIEINNRFEMLISKIKKI